MTTTTTPSAATPSAATPFRRTLALPNRQGTVEIVVKLADGKPASLSVTGALYERDRPHADRYLIACGQIADTLRAAFPGHAGIARLAALWDRWHRNDLRPACAHQMALGWDKEPIDPSKPTTTYGRFGQNTIASWNLKGWLPYTLGGYLGRPCPDCGYRYGTAWLHEEIPADVLAELAALDLGAA